MPSETETLERDRIARCQPSEGQVRVARAMLSACPEATYVMVPIAFPGKVHGWWTKDTEVAHPPGFWLASSDPDAEEWISYRKARDLAEEAAERFLGEKYGQPGYAIIPREGPTPVFEGYGEDPQ